MKYSLKEETGEKKIKGQQSAKTQKT